MQQKRGVGGNELVVTFACNKNTRFVHFAERIFVFALTREKRKHTVYPHYHQYLCQVSLKKEVCVGVYKNNLHTMVNVQQEQGDNK